MPSPDPVNLVLLFSPGAVDPEDYKKIAQRVRAVADNVSIYIHEDRAPDRALIERLAKHRTLVFSPMQIKAFVVTRGRVYAGRPMHKSEQLLRLQLAGVPVPEWAALDRGKRFDPRHWGEYVIVKPETNSGARGVKIIKTRTLNDYGISVEQFTRDRANFVVQKIVYNHAFGKIRIQTLFDAVLYARLFRFLEPVRFETDKDMENYQRLFLTENTQAEHYDSAEVFALAKRCLRTFDDVAMLALDVLVDEAGKPFFIEANPGGNTWHFSSAIVGRMLRARGVFLEQQFGAFELAGDVLAKRALEEAI